MDETQNAARAAFSDTTSGRSGAQSNARTATPATLRGALFVILLVALAVAWPFHNFAGDDAYISFRYARNLATGHGFAFNPNEPTYGSTAPLWVFMMAGLHRLGFTVPAGAHTLNVLFIGLTLLAFWHVCAYHLRRPALWVVATGLLAIDPWLIRWGMSGMENAFTLCLLLTALLFRHRERNSGRVNWMSPLACGLACLTRPEMAVFTLLYFLDLLLFERRALWKNVVVGAAIVAVLMAPWLVYARANFGTIIPNTVKAKAGLGSPLGVFLQCLKYLASFWVMEMWAAPMVIALCARRLVGRLRERDVLARWFLPFAWIMALFLFYSVGKAMVAARYLMLMTPCYLLIGVKLWEMLLDADLAGGAQRFAEVAGLAAVMIVLVYVFVPLGDYHLLRSLGLTNNPVAFGGLAAVTAIAAVSVAFRRPGALVATFVVTSVLVQGYVHYRYNWYVTKWQQGMDPKLVQLAGWVQQNTRKDDLIVADQIGVIGYFSDRYVLDLGALVSPEVLPYRQDAFASGRLWRYLYDRGAQYLFLTDSQATLERRDSVYRSIEFITYIDIEREGAGSSGKMFRYNFYRTHWPHKDPYYRSIGARAGNEPWQKT